MNKENEAKISKARREMERINGEWEVLNAECKRMLNAMAGMGVMDEPYGQLLDMLDTAQALRRALGDQHAAAMTVYFDAVTAHLKEVREGGDLSTEGTEGTEGR